MSGRRSRERGARWAAAMLLGTAVAVSTGRGAVVEDIRDIRGPQADVPVWVLAVVIAGVGLLALAGYGLWRRRRRRPAPILSPLALAERRLAEIRLAMTPAESGRFAVEISAVVREYIEHRFDVRSPRLTSEEFLRTMLGSSDAALVRQRPRLSQILSECDLVKFADVRFNVDAMDALHGAALSFVRETATREEGHEPLPAT